ncbi:MAG: hypothetical protein KatS3mg015_0496 [Fimbriimonadales bacterium]|nr:MAG: hypothetical protein KatS3mg015_0496 [Fimbriimonadales bacterium]
MLFELTRVEVMVVVCAAQGMKDCEAADRLGLSERTVQYHWARIRSKLKANSRPHAVSLLLCQLHKIPDPFPGCTPPPRRRRGGA